MSEFCECGSEMALVNREYPEMKEWKCPCGRVRAENEEGDRDIRAYYVMFGALDEDDADDNQFWDRESDSSPYQEVEEHETSLCPLTFA